MKNHKKHKLYIVGCGIKFLSHLTVEVKALIESCDCSLYLVNDPAMKRWIMDNSRRSLSLDSLYFDNVDRKESYDSIASKIIETTKNYSTTCFVTYGHPLFLCNSSQKLAKEIECENFDIELNILPGISSLDSLCCDLKVDLSMGGMQAYEATDFLKADYVINQSSHIIIWQVGVIGVTETIHDEHSLRNNINKKEGIGKLKEKLLKTYSSEHVIILYVASMYQTVPAVIIRKKLCNLDKSNIPRLATAYIPPQSILYD